MAAGKLFPAAALLCGCMLHSKGVSQDGKEMVKTFSFVEVVTVCGAVRWDWWGSRTLPKLRGQEQRWAGEGRMERELGIRGAAEWYIFIF